MTAPVVDTLPTAPSRNQAPNSFVATADAWVAALPNWTTSANALGSWMNSTATQVSTDAGTASTAATNASNSASAAAASAATAINAPGTSATSTSSVTIGTGTKNFTVQTGKQFVPGMYVQMSATTGNWMNGEIVSYNSGSGALVVNSETIRGSGTFTSWTISIGAAVASPAETIVLITANANATTFATHIFKNAATLTLAASPVTGDWVDLKNSLGVPVGPIADPGSNKIDGKTGTLLWDKTNANIRLTWSGDATIGWISK